MSDQNNTNGKGGGDGPSLTMLTKLMKLTTSPNDHEALLALRKANEQVAKFKLTGRDPEGQDHRHRRPLRRRPSHARPPDPQRLRDASATSTPLDHATTSPSALDLPAPSAGSAKRSATQEQPAPRPRPRQHVRWHVREVHQQRPSPDRLRDHRNPVQP